MFRMLLLNTGSNASLLVVNIVFSFIMAPVIVKALGNYDYGLWEIVVSLLGYMGLLDMGIRPAVTRYVAKFSAVKDKKALYQLLNTAFVFNGGIGLIACGLLIAWAILDPRMLAETGAKDSKYLYFFLILAVQLLLQFPGYIAECFHLGHQRYYLTNNITIFNTVIGNLALYFLLTHGFGLLTLAIGNCIGLVVKYLLYLVLLRLKKYGDYRFNVAHFSWAMLKTMISFGGKSMLAGAAITISGGLPAIIIGSFLGPAVIPFYSLPARLVTYLRDLTMTVANVFMPMFSHLQSLNKTESLKNVYLQATKYIAAAVCPMTIGAILLGPYFIHAWIGPEYSARSNTIFYYLGIGTLLYVSNPLFHRLMTGIDKLNFLIFTRLLFLSIQALLMLMLVRAYGNNGVAFAIMAAFCCLVPIELWAACKNLNVTMWHFVQKVYLPLLIPNGCLFFFVSVMAKNFKPYSYARMGIIVACATVFYLALFILCSMTKDEKAFFYSKAKGLAV
jgi:O-antigen/teichoic acid export membrane protein